MSSDKIPHSSLSPLFQHQSFETVYRKLALPLTKFLVKRTGGNQQAVEEVFSQTIAAAWKGFQTFEHKSSYFTWICRIALNKIADYYREQIHQRSVLVAPTLEEWANIPEQNLGIEEKLALEELCNSVKDCLNLLPYQKRQLLYLRYWKNLSIKKIAQIVGCSERAAEGQIYRAKQEMKRIVEVKHPNIAPVFITSGGSPKNQPSP